MSSAALRHPPSGDETTAGTLLALGVHALLVAGLALGVNWRSHEATPLSGRAVGRGAARGGAGAGPTAAAPAARGRSTQGRGTPTAGAAAPQGGGTRGADRHRDQAGGQACADEKLAEERPRPREAERRKKDEARKKEEARKQEEARQEQARVERQRKENLIRLAAQLPGRAPTPSPGTDTQSAGPSASYTGRVRARILPNIVFTDNVPGRVVAEVQVSVAPDGKITGRKLTRSSGVPSWDEAVLYAIDRTEQLPLDEGRAPPASMFIDFDPNKR